MKDNMDAGPHVREWMGEYVCMMHLRNQKNIIIFFLISSLWMLRLAGYLYILFRDFNTHFGGTPALFESS